MRTLRSHIPFESNMPGFSSPTAAFAGVFLSEARPLEPVMFAAELLPGPS